MEATPSTLIQAVQYFMNPDNCISYLAAHRWPNGEPICPRCGSKDVGYIASRRVWQCKTRHPLAQFSIKVGTIFEDSPIGLDKWLTAMWMISSERNGISSWELHRAIGVTQKSAWFLLHRVRLAMQDEHWGGRLGGEVEADETFIGGKARNMHKERKRRAQKEGGRNAGKTIAFGMVQRGGNVRAVTVEDRGKAELQGRIKEHVEAGAAIFTDALPSYDGLSEEFKHEVINHAVEYVNGNIHTNTMENFWSLLKRSLKGTYVSVEPYHLFRYLDEQAFRYNNRLPMSDSDRFSYLVRKIVGKRLTYAELTGKTKDGPTEAETV